MPKFIVKEIDRKKSIGQVAKELGVESHVIRFWETKFEQIKPIIGKGGRRYYFAKDVEILKNIKHYLYDEGYTISGLQKLLGTKNYANPNSGNISNSNDFPKAEIEKIIHNIEIKLQKLQDFLNKK